MININIINVNDKLYKVRDIYYLASSYENFNIILFLCVIYYSTSNMIRKSILGKNIQKYISKSNIYIHIHMMRSLHKMYFVRYIGIEHYCAHDFYTP